ncbi:phage major capsid protein [Patescibacteria group bacterium]|nr:phage major capsid protein [Patescibacteria group bacterium]
MAITGATYTTIANSLKNDYLPKIQEQLEKKVQTWDLFSKKTDGIKGRDIYMKMFCKYPQGVGAAAAGEALPTPTAAGYEQALVQVKRNYATVEFDAMLEDEDNAIVDIIDYEMKKVTQQFQRELNFQLAAGNGTGARGVVVSIAGQVITLDAPVGQETLFFYPGMYIDIGTGATSTMRYEDILVSSVDVANKQITVVGTITNTVDNDVIYRANQYGLVMMGIPGIVAASGALQSLNPATAGQEFWAAKAFDKGGKWGTSAEDFLIDIQRTIDSIEIDSLSTINLIYAWNLFEYQYQSVLAAKRQIVNSLEFKAGRTGIGFVHHGRQIPILTDHYLPNDRVYFLDTTTFGLYTLRGLHWEEKGGGILKVLERKDVYTAWLKLYAELGITARNANGYWHTCGTTVGDYT